SPSSSSSTVPSASTFSFKAPFPAVPSSSSSPASSSLVSSATLKHRRVSLALPSSPRVVQPWSFRDDTTLDSLSQQQQHRSSGSASPEKRGKMRRISAATPTDDDEHLIPPPVQEKKPRKKWSKEETQMLVSGCQRHGVGNWKTILSDPDLKFDDRSPVDLKDRFRTYFPDAYKQHYPNARTHLSSKVRSTLPDGTPLFEKTRSKKRRPFTEEEDRALKAGYEKHGTVWAAIVKDPVFQEQNRRSTDLRDRFRNAFPDLYQAAGYKPRNSARKKLNNHQQTQHQQTGTGALAKVPLRAATDDQLALSSTGPVRSRRRAHTNQGLLRGGTKSVPQSTACSEDEDSSAGEEESGSVFKHPPTPVLVDNVSTGTAAKNDKNQKLSMLSPFESTFVDDDDEMEMVTIDPLTEPLFLPPPSHIWSSPSVEMSSGSQHTWSTSETSPASSHISTDFLMNSSTNSPPSSAAGNSSGMIGNSAWGTQDWFSPNPRLDPSGGAESSSSSSSFLDSNSGPFPSSPFSFLQNHHHLSQGVMDRYDLFPVSLTAASLGGGSWLHDYSSEAGACDTHSTFSDEMFPPPSGFRGFTHHSNYAGDLIFGARTHQPPLDGLGLSGMSAAAHAAQTNGIHPMQLHTPSLPGIDEIELAGITLNDRPETPAPPSQTSTSKAQIQSHTVDDVDLEDHATPPATPLIHSYPLDAPRGSRPHPSSPMFSGRGSGSGLHARSISVPPSEARSITYTDDSRTSVVHHYLVHDGVASPMISRASRPGIPPHSRPQSNTQLHLQNNTRHTSLSSTPPSGCSSNGTNSANFSPHLLSSVISPPPSSGSLMMDRPSIIQAPMNNHTNNTVGNGSAADPYDLPFLDLHYYGISGSNHSTGNGLGWVSAAGMLFDEPHGEPGSPPVTHTSSPSTEMRPPGSTDPPRQYAVNSKADRLTGKTALSGTMTATTARNHQRGQSVASVCPQDLVLRRDRVDNKRKRASWDG
ncbi:hypothetical protein AMATHDRAFT_127044, partial [Amanita thiersii Skay4041]